METKVISERIVFNDKLVIEEGHLKNTSNNKEYVRLRLNRQDAAVVFIYNRETDKVVLVKQFRYALSAKVKEPILELMAGKVDEGEEPMDTAIREAYEECGYEIKKSTIQHLSSFFASPGYTSEMFHLYYAEVKNEDKVAEGGGLEEENESIEVAEISSAHFFELLNNNKIVDAKTVVGGLLIKQRKLI
jgi:ADP-ribose pyrophosphatase